MKRITLIQCTNSKRTSPAPASDLYDPSAYFRKMRSWAQDLDNPWFILSAKHGLLQRDEVIAPYDEVGISSEQADDIAAELDDMNVDMVDVTAGKKYTDTLIPALEACGIDVVEHFSGLSIGERMAALNGAVSE